MKLVCGCRQWLQELSLGLTASEESASLLENQLRNGVLLCDLAGTASVMLRVEVCYALVLHSPDLQFLCTADFSWRFCLTVS